VERESHGGAQGPAADARHPRRARERRGRRDGAASVFLPEGSAPKCSSPIDRPHQRSPLVPTTSPRSAFWSDVSGSSHTGLTDRERGAALAGAEEKERRGNVRRGGQVLPRGEQDSRMPAPKGSSAGRRRDPLGGRVSRGRSGAGRARASIVPPAPSRTAAARAPPPPPPPIPRSQLRPRTTHPGHLPVPPAPSCAAASPPSCASSVSRSS